MKHNSDDPSDDDLPEPSPADNWDDLEAATGESAPDHPSRKMERGLPPKKVAKGPTVNRHGSNLRIGPRAADDGDASPEETGEGLEKLPEGKKDSGKAAKKEASAKPAASIKKPAKTTRAGKKRISKSAGKKTGEDPEPAGDGVHEAGASVLPGLQPARVKRLNHQIGTGEAKPTPGPSQQPPFAGKIEKSGELDENFVKLRRRSGRGERANWGGGAGKTSHKWMVYSGLGIIMMVVLTVFFGQLSGGKDERGKTVSSRYQDLAPLEEKEKAENDDPEILSLLNSSQDEAKAMYAAYKAAGAAEEISGLVYNRDEVLPLIEKSWKPKDGPKGWAPGNDVQWTVFERDGERYGVLEGMNADFTRFTAFFRKEGGALKLDWKATTAYSSADFAEMKGGKGDGSEIRAWISRADFYTFSLPEDKFRSFRLMSPDGESNLWVYTEIGGESDGELLKLFIPSQITGESQSEIQVQLRMVPGPEDALPTQWMIRDLLRLNWLDGPIKELPPE